MEGMKPAQMFLDVEIRKGWRISDIVTGGEHQRFLRRESASTYIVHLS
jgi:hypothetical protein